MTNSNYTQLSNCEFYSLLKDIVDVPHLVKHLENKRPELYFELNKRTKELGTDLGTMPISAILYCFENDIKQIPICRGENCTHLVKWNKVKHCFREYCCRSCSGSSSIVQEHREQNYMLDHGVKNPFQLQEVKDKIAQKNIERLGVANPSLSSEVVLKRRNTSIKKRGVACPFLDEQVKRKIRQRNLEIRGVENPSQSKEVRQKQIQSCIRNLGVPYPGQSELVKRKAVASNRLKFNCDYYTQSAEYHKNKKHKFESKKYPGNKFDSTWEVKVYEFCKDHNILVEYSPEISYPYEYDGKTCTYHPDFLINGKVYEVKGDYFFRINESTGKEEMFCPYRRDEWTEDEYEWRCGRYEAKHQCMIANDVIILRGKDINNLTIEMFA